MVVSYFTSYVYGSSSSSKSGSDPSLNWTTSIRRQGRNGAGECGPSHQAGRGSKGKQRASNGVGQDEEQAGIDPAFTLIDYLNSTNSLYDVVGVPSNFVNNDELRRAYMARCRVCHPE